MKFQFLLFLSLFSLSVSADRDKDKKEKTSPVKSPQFAAPDDAEQRQEWERKLLVDPLTAKIPSHMRERELMFAKTLPTDDGNGRAENINWSARGPWNVGGMTRALAMDITDENILLAGTNSGGVWRSVNGGASWTCMTPKDDYHGITCISQDKRPGKTNIWYFGSGDPYCSASGAGAFYSGNGLYKSVDSGLTWNKLTSTSPNTPQVFESEWDIIYRVITNPFDTINDVIYAATYGYVWKSSNGGGSFTPVLGNGSSFYSDVNITSTGIVYGTLGSDGGGKGIWRSPDGINFTNITPPGFAVTYDRIVSGITPSNENIVYFLGNTPGYGTPDTNFLGDVEWNSLWRYTYLSGDGDSAGGLWEDLSTSLPTTGGTFDKFQCQGSYDLIVKIKPDDPNTVFIGGTNIYRSTNGFSTPVTNRFIGGYQEGTELPIVKSYQDHHPDQHEILFYPSDPNKMLSGNDGGVFITNNCLADTVKWASLDNGYLTSMFYTVAIDHGTPGNDVVIGGAQDNGSWFTNDTVLNSPWVTPRGGDGSWCAIADGRTAYYLSIQNGKMMRATLDNSGTVTSFARIDPIGGKNYQFINPFSLDPNNNNMMYLPAGKYLWKNTDLGGIPMAGNWDSISTNWVQWPDSMPDAGVEFTSVGISKNPANRVYVGTSKKKLYRIDNANVGTPAMTEITGITSPNAFPASGNNTGSYISCIAVDPLDGDKVIVVFSNYQAYSVFYTKNGGVSWKKVAGNLEQNITTGSGNGPSVRWATIIHPPEGGTAYLLGTSTGLYGTLSLDSTNTIWAQLGANDIGKVPVHMMDYRASDGRLLVATHAAGMYSAYIKNITQVGLSETNQAKTFEATAFPNPSQGEVNIGFLLDKPEKLSVSVYDEMGRTVMINREKLFAEGKQFVKLDFSSYPDGIYYIQLLGNSVQKVLSVVIN